MQLLPPPSPLSPPLLSSGIPATPFAGVIAGVITAIIPVAHIIAHIITHVVARRHLPSTPTVVAQVIAHRHRHRSPPPPSSMSRQ